MCKLTGITLVLCLVAAASHAQDSYIAFDDEGNMLISGPFELTIPKPGEARQGGPKESSPSLLNEELKVSVAGYFGADQFVVVQVETTDAGAGTMSNEHLPVMELAGENFRARKGCADISQEELNADDDPLFEFVERYNVQIVPAVMVMQLVAVDDSGSALGTVFFMRNVPGGCESMTSQFEEKFSRDFERFIESVRAAN
ncbi:MAG: hypothetical protein R3192_11160 [Woeseiaceae bacterium]|nr:hypothetical protein [Woeseiaceae bacterium]